jgi:hypothetical protein
VALPILAREREGANPMTAKKLFWFPWNSMPHIKIKVNSTFSTFEKCNLYLLHAIDNKRDLAGHNWKNILIFIYLVP